MDAKPGPPLSGRRAQAARNNELILNAAREVFVADPEAPISAVAARAGVGIAALYRRYASKEELLRQLARDGLERFIVEAQSALSENQNAWIALSDFMRRIVEADTLSLTQRLAGTFTPGEDMYAAADQARAQLEQLVARARAAGALRPEISTDDISVVLELVASVRLSDAERNNQLRQRYLTVLLDGLHLVDAEPLPGPGPSWEELQRRWQR